MDQNLFNRAKRVFLEAAALPEHERFPYVATVAAGDSRLAAEVASLLKHAGGPTLSPSLGAPPLHELIRGSAEAPDTLIGRTICGRYQIVRPVGSGGMSTVYEARPHDCRGYVCWNQPDETVYRYAVFLQTGVAKLREREKDEK